MVQSSTHLTLGLGVNGWCVSFHVGWWSSLVELFAGLSEADMD
jgi:hypothetical protein